MKASPFAHRCTRAYVLRQDRRDIPSSISPFLTSIGVSDDATRRERAGEDEEVISIDVESNVTLRFRCDRNNRG
jgi:hypothetical protein